MKCSQCQFENPNGAKFCNECGTRLQLACPRCGKVNPSSSKFCSECGERLEKGKEARAIDLAKPQSYTPKHLAHQILTSRSALEGERKIVTVLFADVASYTSLSEKLDPEEVHQIMDGCFQILMAEIHRYEGTINQFTGDGLMALFGAPLSHEDHAQRACHAALAIQRAMEAYTEQLKGSFNIDFRLRIGLNSGPVVVGKIGDDLRMDYTAIGDTTNLASRMQSLASPGAILVSSHTYRLIQDFFEFQSLGSISVKGKEEPQEAYQLIGLSPVETRIEAAVARGLTRFVGREGSMAALREAYEKAHSGAGQVVGIVGEAGVGKSRLLLEFRNRLPQGTFTYLEGRCLQYGSSVLYLPILGILRTYFAIQEGDREVLVQRKLREKLSSLDEKLLSSLPCFQDLLSLKVEDEVYLKLEPRRRRDRIFEALRDLLLRESQHQPLILAIEDLHWIDRSSQELLDYLIGWLASTRILLLLLYRPEYAHPWGNKSYYNRIGLDQLSLSSSTELVAALLEGGEVAPELRQLILTRAAGNPLFMEEFTHTLLENGTIRKEDHTFTLTRPSSEIQVPDTIQGIIAARMDRLQENLKRTLQVASVIGRDFAFRILQMITGMREELKSHLLNLQGLEFIYEKALFPELEYIFKHALTQEVAYNSLLLKRRKEIHERIGRAIEELYPERLEEFYEMLAYHYSRADNLLKACDYLKLSGEKSMRHLATGEAFGFYREALDLLRKQPDTEENRKEKIEILLLLAGPMRLLAYPGGSLALLQEGERLSQGMGEERSLAMFHSCLGNYFSFREAKPLLAVKYGEKSWQEAERLHDVELMAVGGTHLLTAYDTLGKFSENANLAPKILNQLEGAGKERQVFGGWLNAYSFALAHHGRCLGYLGNFKGGTVILEKALSWVHDMNDKAGMGVVESFYGWHFAVQGVGERAADHFRNAIRSTEEAKYIHLLSLSWTGLGEAYRQIGELEAAKKYVEQGLKIRKDAGVEWYLSSHFWAFGMISFDSNDLDEARNWFEQGLRSSHQHQEYWVESLCRMGLGRTLGKAHPFQAEEAEEEIRRGIEMADERQIRPHVAYGYFFLGEFYAARGERETALENLKRAIDMYEEMGMDYWLVQAQAALSKLEEEA